MSQDGVLIYASPDFDYAKARLKIKLIHLQYPIPVINSLQLLSIEEDTIYPLKVHHPEIREEFVIHQVESD